MKSGWKAKNRSGKRVKSSEGYNTGTRLLKDSHSELEIGYGLSDSAWF